MKAFRNSLAILTLAIATSLSPLVGSYAVDREKGDFDAFANRLRTLVSQYYPRAKFEIDGKTIHFEWDAWGDDEYYSGNTGHTLPDGGILGDIQEKPGQYHNELSGAKNQWTTILTPYSRARDSHLEARLHFPTDVSIGFTRRFKEIVTGFVEAAADPQPAATSEKIALKPEPAAPAKEKHKKDEPPPLKTEQSPMAPPLRSPMPLFKHKKHDSGTSEAALSKVLSEGPPSAARFEKRTSAAAPFASSPTSSPIKQAPAPIKQAAAPIKQAPPPTGEVDSDSDQDDNPIKPEEASREPRVRFFPNGTFAVLATTRATLGYSHVGDLAMVSYTFGDPKTGYNRISFQDVSVSNGDPQERNDLYDKAQQSIIAAAEEKFEGGVIKFGRRQFAGQTAREVLITPPEGSSVDYIQRAVIVLASGRLFILESAGPEDFVDSSSSLKVIGSFKITAQAPSMPELSAGTEFFHWQRPSIMTEIKAVKPSSPAPDDLSKSASTPAKSQ